MWPSVEYFVAIVDGGGYAPKGVSALDGVVPGYVEGYVCV